MGLGQENRKIKNQTFRSLNFAEIGGLADLDNGKATMKLQDFDLVLGPFNLIFDILSHASIINCKEMTFS